MERRGEKNIAGGGSVHREKVVKYVIRKKTIRTDRKSRRYARDTETKQARNVKLPAQCSETHWSFLLSASGRDVDELSGESSIADIVGDRIGLPFKGGEPAVVERSSSLCAPNVGLEWKDLDAVASASSLRRASSSRSNL